VNQKVIVSVNTVNSCCRIENTELAYSKICVRFLVFLQVALHHEGKQSGGMIPLNRFKRPRLRSTRKTSPPSLAILRRRWRAGQGMRLESAKWLVVRRHVIPDVGEFIQSDTQVRNLGGHGE
jgi:hypothetical protein